MDQPTRPLIAPPRVSRNFPSPLMEVLRQYNSLEPDDTSEDEQIKCTDPMEVMRQWCSWEFGDGNWSERFLETAKSAGLSVTVDDPIPDDLAIRVDGVDIYHAKFNGENYASNWFATMEGLDYDSAGPEMFDYRDLPRPEAGVDFSRLEYISPLLNVSSQEMIDKIGRLITAVDAGVLVSDEPVNWAPIRQAGVDVQ